MDQSFPAGSGSTACVPYARAHFDCFRRGEPAPVRFARPFGKCRSTVRKHFCLPDARLTVDSSLLARGSVNSGSLAFNMNAGKHSIRGFNAFYFSFITLSTVGYGDITPVSKVARMLSAMEAMTGLLYLAVLIARLVALYSSPKSE